MKNPRICIKENKLSKQKKISKKRIKITALNTQSKAYFKLLFGFFLVAQMTHLFFSVPAYAGGAGGCGVSLTLANHDDVECHNLPMLDPGNDNANTLYMLLSDKGLLDFKPKKPESYGWEYNLPTVPFYDTELSDSVVNLHPKFKDKKHKDSYDHEKCSTLDSGRDAFSKQVQASTLAHSEKQRLITLRKSLKTQCSNISETTANAMQNASDWSKTGVLYAVYIKGVRHFYNNQYDEAKRYFDILKNKSQPWLAETATYMLIRNAIGKAYASGKDNMGFVNISNIKPKYVLDIKSAINTYLKRYPSGLYAGSARGFLRRAFWFAGEQKALINEINWQLAHPNSPQYNIDATNLPAEIVRRVFNSSQFDKNNLNSAMLLATYDLMRMRHIYDYEDHSNSQKLRAKITLAELKQQKPYFKQNPKLYNFLIASYYYYVAYTPKQALAYLPKSSDIQRISQGSALSYTDFSRFVLAGRVYEALKQPKKAKHLWQALAKLPHQPYQGSFVQLALAINLVNTQNAQAIFSPSTQITDTIVRQAVIKNKADDATLHYIINAGHTSETEKQFATYFLLKNNLKQEKYGTLSHNLRLLKKPYVSLTKPDPESDTPQTSPSLYGFAIQLPAIGKYHCGGLASIAKQLHQRKNTRKNNACLAYFLQKTDMFSDTYWGVGATASKNIPSYFTPASLENTATVALSPHTLYQKVLRSKRKDSLRAFALYKLINCYKSSGNNHCGGDGVKKSVRQSWFKQLKRNFPNSTWAKQQKYYW